MHRRDSGTKCGKCRADGRMVANWGRQKLKCLEMEDVRNSFCRFPKAGESGVKAACQERAGQRRDEGEALAFLRAMKLRRNLCTGTVASGGYWAVFLGPFIQEKKAQAY